MEWLNYHHLLLLLGRGARGEHRRGDAEAASDAADDQRAAARSSRSRSGEKLFEKSGRGLVLTEAGRVALRYADEIFALGRELRDTLRDRPTGKPVRVTIGIADVVPKLDRLSRAARRRSRRGTEIEMVCREASSESCCGSSAQHEVDLVLTDAPAPRRAAARVQPSPRRERDDVLRRAVAGRARRASTSRSRCDGAPLLLPGDGDAVAPRARAVARRDRHRAAARRARSTTSR